MDILIKNRVCFLPILFKDVISEYNDWFCLFLCLKRKFSRSSWSSTDSCRATHTLPKGYLSSIHILNDHRWSSMWSSFVLLGYSWIWFTFFFPRDIYYNNTQLFGSQRTVDHIVDDISCLLKVPRRSLHVVSVCVCVSMLMWYLCDVWLHDRKHTHTRLRY